MKNSGHFVLFLKNYIKFIKDNSINKEVFNENFTKMEFNWFFLAKLFWCFIKKNLITNLLILLKILFNKKKEIYVKSICLIHNRLRSLCILFSNRKLITSTTMQFCMFFFTMFIELGIGLQKNFGQKLV